VNWRLLLVLILLCLSTAEALAQQPPESDPVGASQLVSLTWDRSAPPADLYLMPARTVLGFSRDVTRRYGQIHLTCLSSTDPADGSCEVNGSDLPLAGPSNVSIQLTEQRSGLRSEIRAAGYLERVMSGRFCSGDFWLAAKRALNSASWETCGTDQPLGTGVTLWLPTTELGKLVAGHWKGKVQIALRVDINQPAAVSLTLELDFVVTDHNAAAIYLPEFGHATPTVGLNLRYDPFAHTLSGSKLVDVCLYDGLGSQSQYLGLTVRDTSGHAPGPTGFSVWHDDGGTDARRRLDYTLTLDHAGTHVPLVNGLEHQLRNIDSVPLRLVMLPGMTYPVYCVPTPITFVTPVVPSTSKDAGHYGGSLHVELRIPTTSP